MFSSILKAVVLTAVLGLLYLVIWTDATQFSTLYKVETLTCDITYGHVIATPQAKSAIHCSSMCESWTGCRSSVLNVPTETCYLNGKTKNTGNMVQEECGKKLKYIEKPPVSRQCETKTECTEKNLDLCENKDPDSCVVCLWDECSCSWNGGHYNIIDNTCRLDCQNYNDTFEYFDQYHYDWSDKAKRYNVSFEECKDACLSETMFTCTWFSYQSEYSYCTYTTGVNQGQVYYGLNVNRYRRFCADP